MFGPRAADVFANAATTGTQGFFENMLVSVSALAASLLQAAKYH
jgi:hypothetical protein